MDEEKGGLTFGDICRIIWSQKWLALALLLAITIAGTFGLKYGYGAGKTEFVSTFSINISISEDGMLEYPDNTRRNYRDLISIENLAAIKTDNEDFSSVNVEVMRKRGDIKITQNRGEKDVTYTVRVKAEYFSSVDIATEFIKEIACTPSREIYKWAQGLAADAGISFNQKLGNEQKLAYLKSQLTDIDRRFKSLGGISDADKQKVSNLLLTATALAGELHTAYYEPSAAALEDYKSLIKGLESERELAQSVLDNLKNLNLNGGEGGENGSNTILVNGADIIKYAEQVASLTQQINNYQAYIDKNPEGTVESAASKAFTAKLEKLLSDVQSLTAIEECNYYKNTSLISYEGAPLVTEGEIGFVKAGILSLVVGLVVAALVAYIVGFIVLGRKKAATNSDKPAEDKAANNNVSAEAATDTNSEEAK